MDIVFVFLTLLLSPRAFVVMERLLAIFNDASATDELEKCLWNFPLRGEVSLISFIEAVGLNCSVGRRPKEWVIFEIVFHHWDVVVLQHCDKALVERKLNKLPLKGRISLRALVGARNLAQPRVGGKQALVDVLLGPRQDVTTEMVKSWLQDLRGMEFKRQLAQCSIGNLQTACSELGIVVAKKSWTKHDVLVEEIFKYQDTFRRGLPWVDQNLAELVEALEMFRASHEGGMPKRVHRRKDGQEGCLEDRLAMRWRRLHARKTNPNPRAALSSAEIQYVEGILGKDIWSSKNRVDDYIPGGTLIGGTKELVGCWGST